MKKFIGWFIICILAIGVVTLFFQIFNFGPQAKANPTRTPFPEERTASATNTLSYLKAESAVAEHATTTLETTTDGADYVILTVMVTPSSSESVLNFNVNHSLNGINYHYEPIINTAFDPTIGVGQNTLSTTTPQYQVPLTATTTLSDTMMFVYRFDVQSNFIQFEFNSVDSGNNLGLWATVVKHIELP